MTRLERETREVDRLWLIPEDGNLWLGSEEPEEIKVADETRIHFMVKEISNSTHKELTPKNYFEWWYFDFTTDQGETFNVVLHETDIFGLEVQPYASISYLTKGEYSHNRSLLGVPVVRTQEGFLKIEGGVVGETDRDIMFDFKFKDDLRLSGIVRKLAPPAVIEEGVLFRNTRGDSSFWIPWVPRGNFEAILYAGNTETPIRGTAYQDHQWGDLPIQAFASDWVWGHFSDSEISVIFFKILAQDGSIINRFVIASDSYTISGTSVTTDYLGQLILSSNPAEDRAERKLILGDSARLVLEQEDIMRARIDEKHGTFEATYLRWSSSANLDYSGAGRELKGITEYLRIRK